MPTFYAIFIGGSEVGRALNAIKYLAEPGSKLAAHVTVRGPMQATHGRKISPRDFLPKLRGNILTIHGVGNFFADGQCTVYFACDGTKLRHIWWKPSVANVHPHITMYDGVSKMFAGRLFAVLENYPYQIRVVADNLRAIHSTKGQSGFGLTMRFDPELVRYVTGELVSSQTVFSMPESARLRLIDKLSSYVSTFSKNSLVV